MCNTRLSQLINKVLVRSTLVLCLFALLTGGVASKSIVRPITAQPVLLQAVDLSEICTEIGPSSISATAARDRTWTKRVLLVGFTNGAEPFRAKVRYYAPEWSKHANIQLKFVESGPTDIRISFNYNEGSWSVIGNAAERVNKNKATMNLGGFDEKTTEDTFRRAILHEFGHALGLIHEHQSPKATLIFNKEVVYKFYNQRFGWNRNVVDDNIFTKATRAQTTSTPYDPDSIMHYPIPAGWTINGTSVKLSTNLSRLDIVLIKKLYP